MKNSSKWLAAVSAFALVAAPTIAQAAPVGTAVNTDIVNTATVSYKVGTVTQTPITATNTFKVDRKINVSVVTTDTAAVSSSPGSTDKVTTFTVTNNSNDIMSFLLTGANQTTGGPTQFGGTGVTDAFDVSNMRVYVETNGTAGWQSTDTQASALYALASGDFATVYIVSDIPITATSNQYASVLLTATAATGVTQSGTTKAGSGGSPYVATASGTANGATTIETVFADATGAASGDGVNDGKHSARSDYKIDAPAFTVTKVSRVVDDYLGDGAPYYAIPGALVEYCIVVANASTAAAATNVTVSDPLSGNLTYEVGSVWLDGTFNSTDTCADTGGAAGSDGTNWNSGTTTVSNIFATIAAGATHTLRFRAKIK